MAQTIGRRIITIISLVLGVALGGCGYQFGGGGSLLPKDAQTIYVEPFINRSRDVGLDKELTTALRGEMYRKGRLRVVEQVEQADVILSGVVRSLDSMTVSINRFDEVLQMQAQMIVDVNLRRREPNEILWRGPGITLTQIYAGSRSAVVTTSSEFRTGTLNTSDVRRMTDIQLTEAQQTGARQELMDLFAQELFQRLMEMF